jgi:predicted ATP-binding protein involved in virulence
MLHFIRSIKIINLLHINNVVITLGDNNIQHLAIIGKNNGGKTLLLDNLQKCLDSIRNNHVAFLEDWIYERAELNHTKQLLDNKLKFADATSTVNLIQMQQKITEIALEEVNFKLLQYKTDTIYCNFNSPENIYSDFVAHRFLLIYFTENRNFIANIDEHDGYYKDFIAYITQLKQEYLDGPVAQYEKMSSKEVMRQNLMAWLSIFERCFSEIIKEYDLQMSWDAETKEFVLVDVKNSKRFSMLELSKGHLAILGIVSRIIAKAREGELALYDIKGIILIDEVELHLDINLQERVLPFLTQLFPKVQFIISSHNIGVLSHVKDFVTFQL